MLVGISSSRVTAVTNMDFAKSLDKVALKVEYPSEASLVMREQLKLLRYDVGLGP